MGCTSSTQNKIPRPAHAAQVTQPTELKEAEPESPLFTVVVPAPGGADAGGTQPGGGSHPFFFQSRRNSVAANSVTTPFVAGAANSTFFYPDSPQFGPRNHTMSPTVLGGGSHIDPVRAAAAARGGGAATPPTGDSVAGWPLPRRRRESTHSGGVGDASFAVPPDEVRLSMTELARHNNALRNGSGEGPGETREDVSPPHSSSNCDERADDNASDDVVVERSGEVDDAAGKRSGASPQSRSPRAANDGMHAAATEEYAAPLARDTTLTFTSAPAVAAAAAAAVSLMARAPTSSGSAGGMTTKNMLVRSWLSASMEATDPDDEILGHSPTTSGDGSFRFIHGEPAAAVA